MASQTLGKQSITEREKLRKNQRELGDYIYKEQQSLQDYNSETADVAYKKIQQQSKSIAQPREASVDAVLFKNLSTLTSKQAALLGRESKAVSWKNVLSKLRESYGGEGRSLDWEGLGEQTSVFFSSPTQINFMMGPLAVPKKVRQFAQRVKRENAPKLKPLTITHKQGAEEKKSEHDIFQQFLGKKLKELTKDGKETCGMFEFLVNPESYAQTIENLFEFSFLVKLGWCKMSIKNDKPVLRYYEKQAGAMTDTQSVISFNLADFEKAKEIYNITESVLPSRTDDAYDPTKAYEDLNYHVNDESDEEKESEDVSPNKRKSKESNNGVKKKRKKSV